MHRKEMADPIAQNAMRTAMLSNAEVVKPLPLYESKSATDPWAKFREAGRAKKVTRPAKRAREVDDDVLQAADDISTVKHIEHPSLDSSHDPNDLEFTNPPWYAH